MLGIVFKFFSLKILWIFIFTVLCVAMFLLIMYDNRRDELKRRILPEMSSTENAISFENGESVEKKLQVLTENLTEKERMLKQSQSEIKNVEKVLHDMESKTSMYRDRYKTLMSDIKKDVQKTEEEVKLLQDHVSNLSARREELKLEVLKQQEDYQRMIKNFTRELETKEKYVSSSMEKTRFLRQNVHVLRSRVFNNF